MLRTVLLLFVMTLFSSVCFAQSDIKLLKIIDLQAHKEHGEKAALLCIDGTQYMYTVSRTGAKLLSSLKISCSRPAPLVYIQDHKTTEM